MSLYGIITHTHTHTHMHTHTHTHTHSRDDRPPLDWFLWARHSHNHYQNYPDLMPAINFWKTYNNHYIIITSYFSSAYPDNDPLRDVSNNEVTTFLSLSIQRHNQRKMPNIYSMMSVNNNYSWCKLREKFFTFGLDWVFPFFSCYSELSHCN